MAPNPHVEAAPTTEGLTRASDLPNLRRAMRDHGFGAALIDKICHRNWREFLARTLPDAA